METNEEIDVLDQEEEIDIYDDICNFDLGEEIERLKAENKKLEEHICSLKADIDRLNGTIAELKVTQNNLTKNISSLFMSAKTEIERKNRMIEELREKVENRRLRSFKPDFKKRKDRENSPSEANKSKRYKYDESTTRCEVREVPDNDKLEPKPDERQELHSKYSNRQRPVGDSRYQQRLKYPYDKYSNQFENNKYDSRLRYSNETYTESNKFEFKNKYYNERYNNYEDDGYHSRSTYSYDRYRNEMEERYDSRSQYCNDRYKNWTNNRIDGDGTYDNRDYNRNSRSNVEDGDGGQERFDTYADNRRNYQCDSSYYRNERNRSFERPGCSRSGTPFTPFASDVREDTGQNREQDASNVAVNSEMNPERERSLTPMPLPEDIDEPKPKPPKKRLKMLEDMEKKVRQNRLSQTTRLSDQCATNKPSDIDKHNHSWSYDSDRNSITSSKSTKSSKSDRESQGSAQRKEANLVKEKISVKNKTGSSKEEFSPGNHDIHSKKDIKRSPKKETTNMKRKIDNTVEHHMKEMISKLFCSPLELNNEKHKMTNECVSKEPKQKCSKISNAETEQKSNVQESSVKRVEKDVQRTANNGSRKHTQDEIRSSTKNSPEALSVHRNQPEDKILKKPSQIVGFSPDYKRDKKREDKIKETKNQENTDKAKDFENIGKPSENVNKSTKAATNEEIVPKKRRNTPHSFEEPCNSEKPIEDVKENIRQQSVDKVDGQGKTEERVVVKAVVHREVKTTEESVKYSQRCSIRSSKERVVASKDGTTESEQKDKNVEEGKENIRKKSGDKGLNKDNVDGQGKTEEKVVVKAVVHREVKTTEESVKYSQRCSIRSSKERVVASKDGTTESEQKDKNVEEGKENIRKKSVDKGLNKDNVDSQGKTEEKFVAKAVMPEELKTTEVSVKYSQRHNIRSSKERVVTSKDGTTESEQKDKNAEEGKENIRKKSVDKGLNKDNVDGQGKTEEKVVAKAVMPEELKTTEVSVKYSQRHNIRSSKERVVTSKDGTTESEQKDKNAEEGKENIRKKSVDKGLNKDNVDGQGKTEEKVVAKAVMPEELKTTEVSVKYSQRHNIRSSKERVVTSKDGTTENEPKDKNAEVGKENIRKKSVDKGLTMDNVDGQGKTEEKFVAKAVMPEELKITEEFVKYSQRPNIRSSKERVVTSKDGTTESEQKDKNAEEGKENIRKKSVDKGLNKDNVDGQGKTVEKVVAKAVMSEELKTIEESVKYSQRHNIRSSKERVVASKDGTTESEQKDKNVEEGKENIRKKSVDKGLTMDNVDGQGKTEEKFVAKAVMPEELKITEEFVKYSQRPNIRSSKERVVTSKDGTTESEQKDKNAEEGKENIRKKSVDKGLNKDNVDGQGKTVEKVVAKAVMSEELKTIEESVKYSQRHNIRSSKERVVTSKDGTTESEQKDKNAEEGKENIRKQSVDMGLNKDNVDGQGKAEEKVVAKVATHREMKTTEEFVKHSIRRSKEKVVASKEGTTESEQKAKNTEETTRQKNKKVEKQDLKDTDKEQKQKEIIKWPSKMDTDITDEKRQNKDDIKQASDVKGKQDAKGSNKPSRQPTADSKPEAAKQEVTKEDRRKDKSPISKKDVKDKYSKIDPSKKKYNQLIENQFVESERKEGLKENLEEYATKGTNKQLETNKNENVQSEHNIEHAQKNAKRKRKKSDSADQDSNIKNKEENPVEHSTKKEKKRESIISKGDDITKIKESEPSHKQKKGKLSTGSMVKQSHKDKNIAPKHDVDTDVPIQTDEKVIEQCMAVSSEESIQKQVEKRPMEIFAKQDLTDDKNTKREESIKIKKSIETATSDKNIHKNEDGDTKPNTNQTEQRNCVSDVRRRIRFADKGPEDQNGHNKVTIKKNNICEKITEVDQVVLEESEKEQQNNSDETNVTTIKTDDLADKNKKEAENSKNKNPRDSLTEAVTRTSVSTTSSSTNSETDSEEESSDDIFSSIKTVNKLIEIKDVEQERSRRIESVISLTDSSTSDDTVVMSYVNDSKTIEKKFDDLVSHYMENFATENISDNPDEALHTAVDYSRPAPNTDDTGVEVKSQANHLLKENVDKTSEPKIKVLEVINIVNVHKKIELFKSSNDEEVTMVKSKECNTEKPVTTCSNSSNPANQNISPRSARRRITPTPVRDKPLCSFENILTKTSQPDPFTASLQSIGSPLQLTHEGEIPILHLDENHINDLPTEVNINDKNIMNLLDSMNISNIECDIPKFKSFSAEAAVNSEATNAIGGSGCGLTFENKIEKTSTPIKSQVTKSGASNVPNCGGASTSNASSNTQAAAVPSTIQRRRRRCWMIVKD